MRRSVGSLIPAPQNRPFSTTLSFVLSTILVIIPALPAPVVVGRAAPDRRSGAPADAGAALHPAPAAALAAPLAPSITATKVDSFADLGNDGKAEPGDTITYTVTITNNGTDATGVVFSDTIDPNTTLVGGSVATQPIASNDSYSVLGNVRIQPDAAHGLLANDCDPDNGPSCSSAGLTASGPTASAQGGNVSVNADGSFSYNPPAGYEGPDSFDYTVSDGTHTDTATAKFVVSDVVWFVDNSKATDGDGRLTSPFNNLARLGGASDLDEPADVIFVHEGSGAYDGGIVLEDGQRLVGQGTGLDAALASFGITAPAHSAQRPAATGKPALANAAGNVITLANGNTVLSLNAASGAAGSSAVFASGVGGTTLINNVGVGAAGTANGVTLVNLAGSATVANSSVACNGSGTAVLVNGGSAPVGFNSTSVSQNGGQVVYVENRTGGTVLFDASSTVTGTNGAADAVTLVNNSGGSVVTFAAAVQLNTNAPGARGLVADSPHVFTLNMTGGGNAVSSTSGAAIDIEDIAANINFATTFSTASNDNGVRVVNISGAASFGNTVVNNSVGTGVLLKDNSASLTFADLDIAPAPKQRALLATGNTGTITSASGVVSTTSPDAGSEAVAVEVAGTSAGTRTPINLTFTSVSADNALNGIVVLNTSAAGSPGGFRVLGTGATDGSGGTISNITERGASFVNAGGVSLSNMTFTNVGTANGADPTSPVSTCGELGPGTGDNTGCHAGIHLDGVSGVTLTNVDMNGGKQVGINGNAVTGFTLSNSTVLNFGDQVREDGLKFRNLLGTASISNTTVSGNEAVQVRVENGAGALTALTVTDSVISTSSGPFGSHGLLFSMRGTAAGKLVVQGVAFSNLFSNCIDALSESLSPAGMHVIVSGDPTAANIRNSFTGCGASGVNIVQNGAAPVRFNIFNHGTLASPTFLGGTSSSAININQAASAPLGAVMEGAITNNHIGSSGSPVSSTVGGDGISAATVAPGTLTVRIDNNRIRGAGANGIRVQMREEPNAAQRLNLTLRNNDALVTNDPNGFGGVAISAGTLTGDAGTMCAEITGNSAGTIAASNDWTVRQRAATTLQLRGYTGASNSNSSVQTFLDASNDPTGPGNDWFISNTVPTGGGFVNTPGGAQCAQPALPTVASLGLPEEAGAGQAVAAADTARPRPASEVGFSLGRELDGWPSPLNKLRRGLAYSERAQLLGAASALGEARPAAPLAATAPAPLTTLANGAVNVHIGTLRAGDSVTITFQVKVADPFAGAQPQVSNQGTVTADGGVSVQTDDPDGPGASDPTVTPLLLPPDVSVNDGAVAEPATGTANALFTLSLSHPYTHSVTVNYATANGGANPATAGDDYTPASGSVTFAAGEIVRTVAVEVKADGEAGEGNETFLVNLSGATGGTVGDGQATGTIQDPSVPSPVIISELRTSGPGGSGDDFVELLNTTDSDIVVASSDGSAGWAIVTSGDGCSATPSVVGIIPNGRVIPARGNYLLTGAAYSLGAYAAGDAALTEDIEDDRNVGLFTTAELAHVSSANRYDAVGFGTNEGDNCDLLREGANLSAAGGSTSEYSFVRKVSKGLTQDTTDNAADFHLVSTTPSVSVGTSTPTHGAPGPEGSVNPKGPVPCAAPSGSAKFGRELVNPSAGVAGSPNVIRSTTPVANGSAGTLEFRRTFTNNAGAIVSALRFRVVGLSTAPGSGNAAGLRLLSSSATGSVQGTTLETPPAQASGGGVNSSLKVALPPAFEHHDTITLRFVFGVEQPGDYEIAFVLESSPGSGKDIWKLTGHTEDGGHNEGGCNRAPVADAGADLTAECSGGQAAVTLDGAGSTDPDGDTPLTYEWKEGANVLGTTRMISPTLSLGSHTITLKVTDPSGDSSQDTVTVNVVDTTKPVVTPPANITVYTGPGATSCGITVSDEALGTGTATDSCQGGLPVSRSGVPSGNFFPIGTTEVIYSATDAAGNTGTAKQFVTVVDNTAPVVTPPSNVVVPNDANSCSAIVNPGTATATDNCNGVSVAGTRSDNQLLSAPYPVGTTTITWTATDAAGNTATAEQTVTVQDVQPPSVLATVAVMLMGPPFNHALINVGLAGSAADNCSVAGPLQVSVYSDEDDGPAPHSPDAVDINLGSLKLRRERDGAGNGRVYLVVVKATDTSGNTAVSCKTVTVPLSSSAADLASVNAQAASAAAFCSANNGAAPSGYFAVGP